MWALLAAIAAAAPADAPPGRWRTIETLHFAIHYPRGRHADASRTARRVADEAEALWLPLSDATGWFPRDRVDLVVVDHADELAAWALPQRGVVVISAHPGAHLHRMRGRTDGIRSVLAHELGHVWTHEAAGALAEADTGVEIGGLSEAGGAAIGARLVFGPSAPWWWSEGAAEHVVERAGAGWWSAARDRTLRVAALEDRLLPWGALQTGAAVAPADAERGYQQGYAFARWLDGSFGPGTLDRVGALASRRYRLAWDPLLERVTGVDAPTLYARHLDDLRARYEAQRAAIEAAGRVEGEPLFQAGTDGAWTLHPRVSADGRWLGEQRSGWLRLARTDGEPMRAGAIDGAPATWLPAAAGHAWDFVPGRDAVVVVAPEDLLRSPLAPGRRSGRNRLYLVDLSRGRRGLPDVLDGSALRRRYRPLPGTLRAADPAVSPDGRRVAWVAYDDGGTELVVSHLDGGERRVLTAFGDGAWLEGPDWSPDGERLVVAMYRHGQQNLWVVDAETGALEALTQDPHEDRDPRWTADGVLFASDRGGVHDVFRLDPDTGAVARISRVLGGAATPSRTPGGDLLYAGYAADGWRSLVLPRDAWLLEPVTVRRPDPVEAERDLAWRSDPTPREDRPYRAHRALQTPAVAPILRVDGSPGGLRPLGGAVVRIRDALERQELLLYGLVGDGLAAEGAWTWRALGPELTLYGGHEVEARRLDRAGVAITVPWNDDLALVAGAALLEARAAGEVLGSARASIGLRAGDPRVTRRPDGVGGWLSVDLTRGASRIAGSAYGWTGLRAASGWVAPVARAGRPLGGARVELGGVLALTDRDLHWLEEVRAGGDHPHALRLGRVERSLPFPGYAPHSLAGEAAAIGTIGVRAPLATGLAARLGPLHLDRTDLRLAADVGTVHASDPVLLADVVGELRLGAFLLDGGWNSFVRVAWPLVEPPARRDRDPLAPVDDGGPRVYVGLGTGF